MHEHNKYSQIQNTESNNIEAYKVANVKTGCHKKCLKSFAGHIQFEKKIRIQFN